MPETQTSYSKTLETTLYDTQQGVSSGGWGDGNGEAIPLSPNQAGQMLGYMSSWLPHAVTVARFSSADAITTAQDTFTSSADETEGRIWHRLTQTWGTPPDPDDIRAMGSIFEIGGPTTSPSTSLENTYGITPDIVSNITPVQPDGTPRAISAVADGRNLPLADRSVGTIFASCIPGRKREREHNAQYQTLHDDILRETERVVRPGGRVIWSGGTLRDFDTLLAQGFKPEHMRVVSTLCEDMLQKTYSYPQIQLAGSFVKVA